MEFVTLKKDNRKYWIIGSVVVLCLASVVFFVATRANYRVTQKVNIANGIINWSPSDLNVMAIKVSSDGSNYSNTDTVPTDGYILNTSKSSCKLNGTKLNDITIEYTNGKIKLDNLTKKGTKCEFYFDPKPILISDILAGLTKTTRTDFSVVLTDNTTGKIYTAEDNDGTSYYFAGAVDNNWVKFGKYADNIPDVYHGYFSSTSSSYKKYATLNECQNASSYNTNCTLISGAGKDIYWRIIRINGDGTIRLIYNGPTTDQTGASTIINGTTYQFSHKDAYWTSSTKYAYTNDNAYVGYMYGATGASTYEATHANTNSSYAKQVVDEWYSTNLNKAGIKEHIDTNAGFCGDRSLASGTGIGTTETFYGAYNRLKTNKTPSLKCTNTNDLYTVSSSNKGNKALTYPVGLITADEVAYAGAVSGSANQNYYLYTGQYYWTMSPSRFNSNTATIWNVLSSGEVGIGLSVVGYKKGVRPVVNLKADTVFKSGTDGTTTKPYEVI